MVKEVDNIISILPGLEKMGTEYTELIDIIEKMSPSTSKFDNITRMCGDYLMMARKYASLAYLKSACDKYEIAYMLFQLKIGYGPVRVADLEILYGIFFMSLSCFFQDYANQFLPIARSAFYRAIYILEPLILCKNSERPAVAKSENNGHLIDSMWLSAKSNYATCLAQSNRFNEAIATYQMLIDVSGTAIEKKYKDFDVWNDHHTVGIQNMNGCKLKSIISRHSYTKATCDNPACKSLPELSYPPLKDCSRCQSISYCSPQCQKAHWPRHKTACKATNTPAPVPERHETKQNEAEIIAKRAAMVD